MKKVILTIITVLAFSLTNAQVFKDASGLMKIKLTETTFTIIAGGSETTMPMGYNLPDYKFNAEQGAAWRIKTERFEQRYQLYPFKKKWILRMTTSQDSFTGALGTTQEITMKMISE